MTELNSTAPPSARKARKPKKPAKPHKDFPMFAHNNGQWAKKVRQRIHFFGVWADPQAALEKWLAEKDDLLAGRVPRRVSSGVVAGPNLAKLLLDFLTTKQRLRDTGELSPHTYEAYTQSSAELIEALGRHRLLTDLLPEDFERLRAAWAKRWGPVRLGVEIVRTRTVFNYAYQNGLIDRPMRYGHAFKPPSKKIKRLNRAAAGAKMFEADELRKMIEGATQPLRTMLLLAINAGLGNNDIAQMPLTAIDLNGGWLTYPRPKTGIMRRCPLWPETVAAVHEWITVRPTPTKEAAAGLLFITQVRRDGKGGDGWGTNIKDRPISHECRKLLDRLGINGNRNFYAIRHTFETIGGASKDQVAVDAIMGHDDGSMAGLYRERIGINALAVDDRLKAVTEFVRTWLFKSDAKTLAK